MDSMKRANARDEILIASATITVGLVSLSFWMIVLLMLPFASTNSWVDPGISETFDWKKIRRSISLTANPDRDGTEFWGPQARMKVLRKGFFQAWKVCETTNWHRFVEVDVVCKSIAFNMWNLPNHWFQSEYETQKHWNVAFQICSKPVRWKLNVSCCVVKRDSWVDRFPYVHESDMR